MVLKNPEGNKAKILEFIIENNRKPFVSSKCAEEKRLAVLMYNYIGSYRTSSFDPEFKARVEALFKELKIKPSYNPARDKAKILKFIRTNCRIPSQYSKNAEEKRLKQQLRNYTRQSSGSFDPRFDAEVKALYKRLDIKPAYNPEGNKAKILEFIIENGKNPASNSKDLEEKRLERVLYTYVKQSSGSFDPEFKARVERLTYHIKKLESMSFWELIRMAFTKKKNRSKIITLKNKWKKS